MDKKAQRKSRKLGEYKLITKNLSHHPVYFLKKEQR